MIDIGINFFKDHFKKDKDSVITDAIKNGVKQIILTGTMLDNSIESDSIAAKYPNVLFSTAGIHPHRASSFNNKTITELKKLLAKKHVVSVGECGLDFNRDLSPRNIQERVYDEQLQLAVEVQKPLFLHERDAFKRFVEITKQYNGKLPNGVVHCFTGTVEEAKTYLDMGLYIGITGSISDRRFPQLVDVVKFVPLDRLMIETDSPYMMPRNMPRKEIKFDRRNEPAYLPWVARSIAEAKGVSFEEIDESTTRTTKQFFNI
jgi:TatD DNase family protein